ncbi:MAG: cytochrome c-type biogenesis protein CcmH [Proteobacteria bacterium]|nr:cytochrome c-type biogenesis protein CcmH [Pseudomonadota bacterium]
MSANKLNFLIAIFIFFSLNSFALTPEKHLSDNVSEQRAMKLFLEVRCLVCEGQVIENSNTEFAFEMRKLIREKISDGKSDKQIKSELVKEFGSDILVYSDFDKSNFLLWLLPIVFGITVPVYIFYFRKK